MTRSGDAYSVPQAEGVGVEETARWRARVVDGTAVAECDRIVRSRPVPDRLMLVLANLILADDGYMSDERPSMAGVAYEPTCDSLTPRQTDVLFLYSVGKQEPEIALMLGLTRDGVEYAVRCARALLKSANTTAAVASALRLGLFA